MFTCVKQRRSLAVIALALALVFSLIVIPEQGLKAADGTSLPGIRDNLDVYGIKYSRLIVTEDGYMRVYYDGNSVRIEYLDKSFNVLSKKAIDIELDWWGGFYAGEDAYYIVEGQPNKDEKDDAEVIRVTKYDKKWKKKGVAKITSNPELYGGKVRFPFEGGCVEMTEVGGKLYLATGHVGYVDAKVGQGHQGYLLIEIDKSVMKGKIVSSNLNHSFAQYLKSDGDYLYFLEQNEGGRCTEIRRHDTTKEWTSGFFDYSESLELLKYGGTRTSSWAIACCATVDDLALSSNNTLCIGTSIDQNNYYEVVDGTTDETNNIYLSVTPKNAFMEKKSKIKWLTSYTNGVKEFKGVFITEISDNRFLVSWEEYDTEKDADFNDMLSGHELHYLFVDGDGNKLTKEFTVAAALSDCHPVLEGSKIVFYASGDGMVNFYTIDSDTGVFAKKSYMIIGENATWDVKDGILTISGTGALNSKIPGNGIKGIVIGRGITEIPDDQFSIYNDLNEVEIPNTVTKIGKEAFAYCGRLKKITISDSVKEIGEKAIGGWNATIYAHENSYAAQYAKANNIRFEAISRAITTSGIYCSQTSPLIVAGMVIDNKELVDGDIEYRWLACEESAGVWFEVSPWTVNNEWINWTPEKSGNYVFICYARIVGQPDTEINATFGTPFTAPEYREISKAIIASIPDVTYTGSTVKPFVSVKYGSEILKNGKDYSIVYSNNTKVGTASVKIIGMGLYNGTVTKTFRIVKDETADADISYRTYVQSYGWQSFVKDGSVSGTYAQAKRLEGMQVKLSKKDVAGGVTYRTYVQKLGWQPWSADGATAGTMGRSLRLETMQLKLTGNMAKKYDVYYRVQAQKFGWMDWAKNGASAGTAGFGYRLEAVQIKLVPKGGKAPGKTANPYVKK
ncbi:MAG: leucine-rich repeat protein [Lachnospiraceae bacterium]|nr:leucine-rich repeat protein [Lachnospiraceae bacterium]